VSTTIRLVSTAIRLVSTDVRLVSPARGLASVNPRHPAVPARLLNTLAPHSFSGNYLHLPG
jgi:hypothetical protein